MVTFKVIDPEGVEQTIEVPSDMNLSLMEVLKASDYPIPATCGGIALCATCHVDVTEGADRLGNPTDAELDMIDTLPNATANSRLACQIRIGTQIEGVVVRLASDGQ